MKLKNSNELRFIVNNRNTVIEFLKSKMESVNGDVNGYSFFVGSCWCLPVDSALD